MSRVTSSLLKTWPASAAGALLNVGASGWVSTAWAEVIAAADAPLYIGGLAITGIGNHQPLEIDIAVGASGAETVLHTVRYLSVTQANVSVKFYMLPLPIGAIGTGARVALRARSSVAAATLRVHLLTYTGLTDCDHKTSAPLTRAPVAANDLLVTPSATAWAWSSWTELVASLAQESALLGVHVSATNSATVQEWEIGTGAAGAETGITTVRHAVRNNTTGLHRGLWLPAPMPLAAGTRVAARLRKSGTDVTNERIALLYIDGTALL